MNGLTFGDWLRGQRRRMGWSQAELARRVEVSPSYVSRVEGGSIGLPEPDTRSRFHIAFGTTEAELEALGIVPRFDEWGRVIPVDLDDPSDALPVRQVDEDERERDNSPLTAAERAALADVMFHGFDELEPADLREVIAIIQRRKQR